MITNPPNDPEVTYTLEINCPGVIGCENSDDLIVTILDDAEGPWPVGNSLRVWKEEGVGIHLDWDDDQNTNYSVRAFLTPAHSPPQFRGCMR